MRMLMRSDNESHSHSVRFLALKKNHKENQTPCKKKDTVASPLLCLSRMSSFFIPVISPSHVYVCSCMQLLCACSCVFFAECSEKCNNTLLKKWMHTPHWATTALTDWKHSDACSMTRSNASLQEVASAYSPFAYPLQVSVSKRACDYRIISFDKQFVTWYAFTVAYMTYTHYHMLKRVLLHT